MVNQMTISINRIKFIVLLFGVLMFVRGTTTYAQIQPSDSIHFVGQVYDAETLMGISEVHVLGQKYNTTTGIDGGFSLWACKGDSIRFSHVSHKTTYWMVSDTITNPDMLIGIFLSRDTVALAEVVIHPRLMSLESLMTQPLPQDKDTRNAKNNLKVLGYQARNNQKTTWDAEDNTTYALQKRRMQAEYAGMLSPDDMVSITAVIPLAIALLKQKYANDNKEELKLNNQEEELLKSRYVRRKIEEE